MSSEPVDILNCAVSLVLNLKQILDCLLNGNFSQALPILATAQSRADLIVSELTDSLITDLPVASASQALESEEEKE